MTAPTGPVRPPAARTALVTGAGRGLGRAIALGLAAAGVRVAVLGRSPVSLAGVLAELEDAAPGGGAVPVVADVRDLDAVREAVVAAEAGIGAGIDLLVNNAGVIEPVEVPVWEADPDDWWDVVETDLRGPFHCVRAVVPGMLAHGGGRVVDLSSGAGATDREIYSAYCAAKAGLFRITGNLHLAGFGRGLRAFEISPGVVRSDMTTGMAMHADRSDWTPVERLVELVVAVASGRLDAWSGRFLRAGIDDPEVLAGRGPGERGRLLGVLPYGPEDPLA
jgi:NAD(P)-dependent dehydrogenase (short-subunit alcohol dehydrogenase family)